MSFCIVFFPIPIQGAPLQPIPPFPKPSPLENEVAIMIFSKNISDEEKKNILHTYPNIKLRKTFKYALNGVSIEAPRYVLEKLAESNQVEYISPVKVYEGTTDSNIKIIEAEDVRGIFDKNDERLTGKGITIGVIDTGIDYHHPDLYRNYKGGHDLVDGDDDPMETKGDSQISTHHGTHVAGIIAANGQIRGVAPEANIRAYRALGPGGSGTTEQVLAAIEEAIKDQVDIINLSLGNSINGPDLPISIALNEAVDRGIVAVASAGNAGPNMWTVGSPGTASKAISVGASTPPLTTPILSVNGIAENIKLNMLHGSPEWDLDRTYEIVHGGLGKKEEIKDVEGKIVLIERGEITFAEKAENAQKNGAVAVIIYNNLSGAFTGNLDREVTIPVATISKQEGKKLTKQIKKQTSYAKTSIMEEVDKISDFSSRGPVTRTWEMKPDVVAPGVAIKSTVPGGYLALQGTSMAAPHVAGACALIKQKYPHLRPAEIKAMLMNTAKPLINEKGEWYRTYEQGAGRIQISKAIQTETVVMPSAIQFGKFHQSTQPQEKRQYVTIKNISNKKQGYSFLIPKKEEGMEWQLPLSFQLEPFEARQVEIKLRVNPNELKDKVYDGYLTLQAGKQMISLPYLYVLEEPDYPRVMGFDFASGDEKGTFRYEVYLPGGAEEFGIALFSPDTYHFVGFLDTLEEVGSGLLQREIKSENLPETGLYIAKIFARKKGKEDMIESTIFIYKED